MTMNPAQVAAAMAGMTPQAALNLATVRLSSHATRVVLR